MGERAKRKHAANARAARKAKNAAQSVEDHASADCYDPWFSVDIAGLKSSFHFAYYLFH
jgi:hypothetical protein